MPRPVEEILRRAQELAERFERYEPTAGDELDAGAVDSALSVAGPVREVHVVGPPGTDEVSARGTRTGRAVVRVAPDPMDS